MIVCCKQVYLDALLYVAVFNLKMSSKCSNMYMAILILLINSLLVFVCGQLQNYGNIRHIFMNQMIKQFGNGTLITLTDLEEFYSAEGIFWNQKPEKSMPDCFSDFLPGSYQGQEYCLLKQCLSPGEVFELSGLSDNTGDTEVCTMSMILLHLLENKTCSKDQRTNDQSSTQHHKSPSSVETWGYGILCTSIIVLAALCGFLTLPFVHGVNYQRTLNYMVGLAVGTLAGSSLLFLAPEALELTEQEMNRDSYVWKCLVMVSAIYAFFIIERVLKMVTGWRERRMQSKPLQQTTNVCFISLPLEKSKVPNYTDLDIPQQHDTCTESVPHESDIDNLQEATENGTDNDLKVQSDAMNVTNKHLTDTETERAVEKKHVAPVAWMIIFGDALHNFIDGISIGAAFTDSVLVGVSVSVAVFCEELPHELGDFAVLLSAGMNKKKAVVCNFLSACTIYLGMLLGIFLGENTAAHTWVFAFASGMFLYIALVVMMPAMWHAGEVEENKRLIGTVNIFILQNLGMLTGFGIMLVLAIYVGHLEEGITDGL